MAEALTPEEAREWAKAQEREAAFTDFAGRATFLRRAATLRAYADQSERLKEIEEAVREMLPHYEGMETGDGEPCPQMARLRSLMEKK